MSADQERRPDASRYVTYTLVVMTAGLFLGFLYLYNFTSFFRLAVPL